VFTIENKGKTPGFASCINRTTTAVPTKLDTIHNWHFYSDIIRSATRNVFLLEKKNWTHHLLF